MPRMTQAELAAYYARQSGFDERGHCGSQAVAVESDLHNEILDECKRRGWIALHGSMAQATARTIGEPDFVILADCGRVLLVEAKAKRGKLSPEQRALHAWARKLGHTVYIVRSMSDFIWVVQSGEATNLPESV
jgi:hypothetical protein